MQINPADAVTPAVLEFISQDNCRSTWLLEHCHSRVVLVGREMPCRRALCRVAGAPCSSPAYHRRQRLCALYQEASLPALGSGSGFCGAASSQPQAAHRLWTIPSWSTALHRPASRRALSLAGLTAAWSCPRGNLLSWQAGSQPPSLRSGCPAAR